MNKILLFLLFSAFVFTGTGFAQTQPPAAPVAVAPAAVAHHDRHAELHKAIRRLREAREALEKALHDYGGHRAKAIAAVDQALEELRLANAYVKG